MDCSPPGSSLHGIFQARILEWVAISYSGSIRPGAHFLSNYLYCPLYYFEMKIIDLEHEHRLLLLTQSAPRTLLGVCLEGSLISGV